MKLAELVPEKSVELLDFVLERSQDWEACSEETCTDPRAHSHVICI